MMVIILPVSYTHLDVYKRQPSTYQSTSMLRIKQAQGLSNSVLSSANAYSDAMSRQLMNTDA